jgi:hypothetical protein
MMIRRIMLLLIMPLFLAACAETTVSGKSGQQARILAMGDSLLATHKVSGNAVSNFMERALGEPVVDRSVLGAHMIYNLPVSGALGMNIGQQYVPGNWDWVVLNGGGNDLWLGCGCSACSGRMNRMIDQTGSVGHIPGTIARLRASGAKVIYVGYMRSPGFGSPVEHCRALGDELERRVQEYAARDSGVFFLSLQNLVPHGDRSFHAFDMIHPSQKGSAAIASRIAGLIRRIR